MGRQEVCKFASIQVDARFQTCSIWIRCVCYPEFSLNFYTWVRIKEALPLFVTYKLITCLVLRIKCAIFIGNKVFFRFISHVFIFSTTFYFDNIFLLIIPYHKVLDLNLYSTYFTTVFSI